MDKYQSLADFLGVEDPSPTAERKPTQAEPPNSIERVTAKSFCRQVLDSREYRESLYRRIVVDELPAAVELMLYDRAYGKTVDKLEVKDVTSIENLTVGQLEDRAMALVALARRMRRQQEGEEEPEPMAPSGDGVH